MIRAYLCRHIAKPDGGLTNPLLDSIDALKAAQQPRASVTMYYPRKVGGVLKSAYCLVIASGLDAETFASIPGVDMLPVVNYKDPLAGVAKTSLEAILTRAGFSAETVKKATVGDAMSAVSMEIADIPLAPSRHTRTGKESEWGNG